MDVQYSTELQQSAKELALVEQASAVLSDVLGPHSSQHVKAEWNRMQDQQGRMLYNLTIQDSVGKVSTDFAPDELVNPLHIRYRMYRLWGDLLQVRNNRQHEEVERLSREIMQN